MPKDALGPVPRMPEGARGCPRLPKEGQGCPRASPEGARGCPRASPEGARGCPRRPIPQLIYTWRRFWKKNSWNGNVLFQHHKQFWNTVHRPVPPQVCAGSGILLSLESLEYPSSVLIILLFLLLPRDRRNYRNSRSSSSTLLIRVWEEGDRRRQEQERQRPIVLTTMK